MNDTLAVENATARPSALTALWKMPWLTVSVGAFAMVATMPGRTHGLGLITEPLLRDLHLDRVDYAAINLWATLLGAAFCLPWGWLIDRLGTRAMLLVTLVALGLVVIVMGQTQASWTMSIGPATLALDFFLLVLLTRGLGQSALSVVSITMLGRSAQGRSGVTVGVYSFMVAIGFMGAFALVKLVMETWEPDWRTLWSGMGAIVLLSGPLAWLLLPRERAATITEREDVHSLTVVSHDSTLGQALASSAFWVFGLATSLYGLVAAGVSLFNQAILAERGFDRSIFLSIAALMPLIGLASNLVTGWLANLWSLSKLLSVSMAVLAAALAFFPLVETQAQVYMYAAAMGIAGGMITVIFFAVWRRLFGKRHLGQIQGAAQMLTVLASAVGPLLLASCQSRTGSYIPFMQVTALVAAGLGVAAWLVHVPQPENAVRPLDTALDSAETPA